ncbi:MAG: VOC family protein [Burkholderiales bacterium]|nr:VOC family protein [Burkholderiales bacterium]MCL4689347.1 VOC family protein [Burkholderiales bacterium]
MLESIGQVAVNVKDTARARAFYRDVLGLRHLFDAGPDLAFFQCGGVRLMLSPPSERQFDHPGSIIYYKVSDLAATHATIAARGAAFEQPPHLVATMPDHELWMAFLRDSEGNLLALMEEKRPG